MDFNIMDISRESVNKIRKSSPKILLWVGIGTGVLAVAGSGLASFKAAEVITDIHNDPRIKTRKDLVIAYAKHVVPLYIPVAILEGTSVLCLVKSYDINAKRLAAATALAEISTETLRVFREKAKERLGEEKYEKLEQEVREEQNKNDETKVEYCKNDIPCYDVVWFHDTLTNQEFVSTPANVLRACIKFSHRMENEHYMTKNDWIDILKEYTLTPHDGTYQIHEVPDGQDVGWFRSETVEVYMDKIKKSDKGLPCIYLEYYPEPTSRFESLGKHGLHSW